MEQTQLMDKKKRKFLLIMIGVIAVVLITTVISLTWNRNNVQGTTFNGPSYSGSAWENTQFHFMLMFRTLLLPDSEYQTTELDLAESFTILNDGLTYEVIVKDGVLWSDGEPFTVADVVFSIEAASKAADTNGTYTLAFSKIVGYQEFIENESSNLTGLVVSDNKLTIQLSAQYPTMEQTLAQFAILPQHILGEEDVFTLNSNEYWKKPVVSGMYQVGETTNDMVTLVKNELYAGEEPLIDTIQLHTNDRQESLDYYSTNNLSDITNYRTKVGVEEYLTSSLFYRYFIFNMKGSDGNENEAMQDVRVRKAIGYAINRESILNNIYGDTATILNSGVPSGYDGSSRQSIVYDPELAISLLEEAEYDFERPLVLAYYYTDNVSESFMYAVANDLRAVGFEVELVLLESANAQLYTERAYDVALKGLSAFSISEWYGEYDNENNSFKYLYGGDTVFEPYVEALSTEVDATEIINILANLQALEHEEFYKIPLCTLNQYVYINTNRVSIPNEVEFGNSWYRNDIQFEQWSIK